MQILLQNDRFTSDGTNRLDYYLGVVLLVNVDFRKIVAEYITGAARDVHVEPVATGRCMSRLVSGFGDGPDSLP